MICCNLRTFWKTLGKKSALFGQKQCFLGKKCPITWSILHIIMEWSCKFAITLKNDAFANTRLMKTFVAISALAERLPTSATLPLCREKPWLWWWLFSSRGDRAMLERKQKLSIDDVIPRGTLTNLVNCYYDLQKVSTIKHYFGGI